MKISIQDKLHNMAAAAFCANGSMTIESLAELSERLLIEKSPEIFADIEGAKKFFKENRDNNGNYTYIESDEDGRTPARDFAQVCSNVMSIIKMDLDKFIAYPEVPVEVKQDVIPAYEEITESPVVAHVNVEGDTSNDFAKIDLGTGLPFDPDVINSEIANQFDESNPARFFLTPFQFNWNVGANESQQIPVQQIPVIPVQQPVQQVIQRPIIHKVDEPPKPPKKETPEDAVDVDLNKINIDNLKVPPVVKQVPEFINPITQPPAAEPEIVQNMFDNIEIVNKFTKIPLLQIQAIANKYSCSVEMTEYPHINLISVLTYDHHTGQVVPSKSFVIDSGMIIDKRIKLIATNPVCNPTLMLENAPIYELFITDVKNHGRKVLDDKMINDIFMAGFLNVTKKEMYTENYKKLNTKLALITVPTKGLNKEERNALQDYIIKMDNDGYLDSAIAKAPNSRFVFVEKQLDKNKLSNFTLINQGVPLYYGTPVPNNIPAISIDHLLQ